MHSGEVKHPACTRPRKSRRGEASPRDRYVDARSRSSAERAAVFYTGAGGRDLSGRTLFGFKRGDQAARGRQALGRRSGLAVDSANFEASAAVEISRLSCGASCGVARDTRDGIPTKSSIAWPGSKETTFGFEFDSRTAEEYAKG